MLKEILEQGITVTNAMRDRVDFESGKIRLRDFPWTTRELKKIKRVVLVGSGTSLHAAQVGRTYMERLAGLSRREEP